MDAPSPKIKIKVHPVFANDLLERARHIYQLKLPTQSHFQLGDLNQLSVALIASHQILTGGFPCQPFSITGQGGFDDVPTFSGKFWKSLRHINRWFCC